jgi:hypothetical protein
VWAAHVVNPPMVLPIEGTWRMTLSCQSISFAPLVGETRREGRPYERLEWHERISSRPDPFQSRSLRQVRGSLQRALVTDQHEDQASVNRAKVCS